MDPNYYASQYNNPNAPNPQYNPNAAYPNYAPPPVDPYGYAQPNPYGANPYNPAPIPTPDIYNSGGYVPNIDPYASYVPNNNMAPQPGYAPGYPAPVDNSYQAKDIYTSGGATSYGSGGIPTIPQPDIYTSGGYGMPNPGVSAMPASDAYSSNVNFLDPYATLLPSQMGQFDPSQNTSGVEFDQEEEQPEEVQGKVQGTGGLLGKLALKVGQVGGTATGLVAGKASNLFKKITNEYHLNPPPGGYSDSEWEPLTKSSKFTVPSEIEFLYYEFKTHINVPVAGSKEPFKPVMSFEQFSNMLPQCFVPGYEEHFKRVSQQLHTVFKWGTNEISFETFAKAMGIIVRGNPSEKLPILYDIIMDPFQRIASPDSARYALSWIVNCNLNCPSAGNIIPTMQDIDAFIMSAFPSNMPVPLPQFIDIVMAGLNNPYGSGQRIYGLLMDCFGLFPFFFFNYFEPAEQYAHNLESVSGRKPHKEGFLIKAEKGLAGMEQWNSHWAVVDSGFLYYYPPNNNYDSPSKVIFLGESSVRKSTSNSDPPFCFEVIFGQGAGMKRKLCAQDEEHLNLWINVIQLSSSQARFPYHSFAPPREGTNAKWFIDGKDTYTSMADALEGATQEIFITDWFFSPQVFMRRYNDAGKPEMKVQNRLDFILKKKAEQGVKIYVLPWSETKIAIDLASANVKSYLESLHPNIKVICHPLMYPIKWSHHQKNIIVDQKIAFVGGLDTCFGRWDDQNHDVTDVGPVQRFPGKDYYNPGIHEFANVQDPRTDILNRNTEPRMPWHDIHMRCEGDAARDVAANFIQRWNHHHQAMKQHKPIVPKTSFMPRTGNTCVQVIRSVCDWSAGVTVTEHSIYNAYLDEIEKAENFIYIENQFFISASAGSAVENQISLAIMNKIRAAARERRVFRVIVIVPVHPEGGYKDTMTVRYIMGWQYKTVCKGGTSMWETFRREFPQLDPYEYFNFYVIKNWGVLGENLVAEQIYVHAKLMIIDDRTVIVGSANINDRSMLGTRDSEIGVVIKDRTMIDGKMNGRDFKVARFAHDLRVNLFLEHLGLTPNDYYRVQDPICPETYSNWLATARANTEIYNVYFFKSFFHKFSQEAHDNLKRIKGHIMEYDQNFLSDEEMNKKITNVDIILAGDDIFV